MLQTELDTLSTVFTSHNFDNTNNTTHIFRLSTYTSFTLPSKLSRTRHGSKIYCSVNQSSCAEPGPAQHNKERWAGTGYSVNAFQTGQLRLTVQLASVGHIVSTFYALKFWQNIFVTVTFEQHINIPGERSTH